MATKTSNRKQNERAEILLSPALEKSPLWRKVREKLREQAPPNWSVMIDTPTWAGTDIVGYANGTAVVCHYPGALAEDFAAKIIASDVLSLVDSNVKAR